MSERDLENPVPGLRRPAGRGRGRRRRNQADLPLDVDEADAAEQRREVKLDEDDYR